MKILLASNDLDSADILGYSFRRDGFEVVHASDTDLLIEVCREELPDVILIDQDAFESTEDAVFHRLRSISSSLVVMRIRPKDDEIVRVLELGVDDYVIKPVSPKELLARIKAITRRTRKEERVAPIRKELSVGDMVLRVDSHEVMKSGEQILLTPIEFRILYHLVQNRGQVVSRQSLSRFIWGYSELQDLDTRLRSHISRLRKKLRLTPNRHGYIRAVSGMGYVLQA